MLFLEGKMKGQNSVRNELTGFFWWSIVKLLLMLMFFCFYFSVHSYYIKFCLFCGCFAVITLVAEISTLQSAIVKTKLEMQTQMKDKQKIVSELKE